MTERVLEASERTRAAKTRQRISVRPQSAKSKLAGSFHTPLWHRVAERLIAILALAAVLAIALIFVFIAREAVPMLWEAEFAEEVQIRDLFFAKEWKGYDEPVFIWQPVGEPAKFNVVPLFIGSLKVTLLAMLMSVPLGVGCAMFIALYAPRAVREVVKPVIELLAGIPSVVLGFFALMVLASWAQATFGFHFRLNAFVAAIGLALTIVPVIFTISEDAIQAVPSTLTEAALALGARKYQVALRVVLPAAIPGIAAGVVLGFGRAIGETMIVLMASGNAAIMELFDFSTSVRTVTATIAAELGEVAQGDPHWRVLFLLGVMLFGVTFVLNILGDLFIQRLQKRLTAS
ncbi:MAG: phosphate ABC transporter permease subunit PstC [Myxococcales bacterium]|nr:phosphate ABC transporter permease subunit PstC [Myxococcales bacterium]